MTALTDWLDSLPQMLTTTAAGNLRTFRRVGGSNGTTPDRPRLIVIHTMETPEDNRAQSTARWVQAGGGTAKVSCHFCVDNDEAIRCVLDEHVAFTQLTPWNDMSLSIEQSGRAASTADDWQDDYSIGQRALVAKIVAAWSEKWGIPLRFIGVDELVDWRNCTGVTTHYQLSLASQRPELLSLGYKPGNHWDPGPNYPMDQMLAEAAAHLAPPVVDPSPPDQNNEEDGAVFKLATVVLPDGTTAGAKFRALCDTTGTARHLDWLEDDNRVARCSDLPTLELDMNRVFLCSVDRVPVGDVAFAAFAGRDWARWDFLASPGS